MAGVELREVNRVIDEGILPKDLFTTDNGRHVVPIRCIFIAFYVGSAERLTAKERIFVMRAAGDRLRNQINKALRASLKEDWRAFRSGDLVNQVLEISTDGEDMHILRCNLPA